MPYGLLRSASLDGTVNNVADLHLRVLAAGVSPANGPCRNRAVPRQIQDEGCHEGEPGVA